MDSDKCSAQIERLEVVDTGRRRRWTEDEKLKIVLESLQTPRQVSATARRYGISRSLLIHWRRAFRAERHDTAGGQIDFVPAMVIPALDATPAPIEPTGRGTIEMEFTTAIRMRVTGAVDGATLTTAVSALLGGRRR